MPNTLRTLFTTKELTDLYCRNKKIISHPLCRYLGKHYSLKGEAYKDIDNYVEALEKKDMPWLKELKKRLIDTDGTNSDSAFAEIRCYAELVTAGYNTEAIQVSSKTGIKTTDFKIKTSNEIIYIDAKNKTQNPKHIQFKETYINDGLTSNITSVEPFGLTDLNKVGDSPTTNAISKTCNIAGNDSQFKEEDLNVLWLDFRSFSDFPQIIDHNSFLEHPIIQGEKYSGEIWHGFYGIKNSPLFEDIEGRWVTTKVLHNGCFAQGNKSKFNGAIIQINNTTAYFRNYQREALPKDFLDNLKNLPYFDEDKSNI